ncbi:MAG: hypothetical protein IJ735_02725 [Clostridia bacterium]|nr:hypothetical protein [Clostridia bacterium]
MKKKDIERTILKSLGTSDKSPDSHILAAAKEEMRERKATERHLKVYPFVMTGCVAVALCLAIVLPVFFLHEESEPNTELLSPTYSDVRLEYTVTCAESDNDEGSTYGSSQFSGVCIDENCIGLFRSKQELIEFCDGTGLSLFEIKGEDPYHIEQRIYESDLGKKIRSYGDSFFNEKSLVLVFVVFPNVYPAKIEDVYLQDDELIVEIARPETDSFLDALSHHSFVIEVDKKSVEDKTARLTIVRKGVAEDYSDNNGHLHG